MLSTSWWTGHRPAASQQANDAKRGGFRQGARTSKRGPAKRGGSLGIVKMGVELGLREVRQ